MLQQDALHRKIVQISLSNKCRLESMILQATASRNEEQHKQEKQFRELENSYKSLLALNKQSEKEEERLKSMLYTKQQEIANLNLQYALTQKSLKQSSERNLRAKEMLNLQQTIKEKQQAADLQKQLIEATISLQQKQIQVRNKSKISLQLSNQLSQKQNDLKRRRKAAEQEEINTKYKYDSLVNELHQLQRKCDEERALLRNFASSVTLSKLATLSEIKEMITRHKQTNDS